MIRIIIFLALICLSKFTQAYEIYEVKLGIKASNLAFAESVVIPKNVQQAVTSPLSITAEETLSTNGQVLWSIDNNSGQDLQSVEIVTYLDIEIDQAQNTFFNETASLQSLSLPTQPRVINNYIASAPIAWQIDEPGYRGGQLNTAYRAVALNSRNALSANTDDVAVAFQHSIPLVRKGERIYVLTGIGNADNNGIEQSDPNSNQNHYLNSIVYTPRLLAAPLVSITAPTTSLAVTGTTNTITDSTIRVSDDTGILVKDVVIDTATTASYQNFTCQQTNATQVDCSIIITDSGNLVISATDSDNLSGQATQNYRFTTTIITPTQPPRVVITAPTTSLTVTDTVKTITDSTIRVSDDTGVLVKDVVINTATTASYQNFACRQTNATQVDCSIIITDSGNLVISATDSDNLSGQASQRYTLTTKQPPQVTITAPTTNLTVTDTVKTITDSSIRVSDDTGVLVKDVVIDAATTASYQNFTCRQTTATQVDCTIVITDSGNVVISATDSDNLSGQASQRYTLTTKQPPQVTITAPTTNLTVTDTVKTISDSTIRVSDDTGVLAKDVVIDAATTASYQNFTCRQTTATQVDCTIVITDSGNVVIAATDSDNLSGQATQRYTLSSVTEAQPIPAISVWALLALCWLIIVLVVRHRKNSSTYHYLAIIGLTVLMSFPADAGSLTGGDATSQDTADVVLDLVFISDNSGSMRDETQLISETMPKVVEQLSCPKKDIWVRSRYMGLTYPFRDSALFNESLTQVLKDYPIKQQGVESFHTGVYNIATYYPYVDDTRTDQGYVKAVVTIGDGGNIITANTHTETYEANKAAIDNDVIVFSVLANDPFAGAENAMTALSQGGFLPPMKAGERPFLLFDTKGTLSKTEDNHLREDLEQLICGVAQRYRAPVCTSQLSVRGKFGKVQVSAENNHSNESYSVYRSTQLNGSAVKIATLSNGNHHFLDNTVQANRNYYYQLKKENANGEAECESPIVSAFVPLYIADKDFNLAPIFTSQPPSEIKVGQILNYTPKVKDFDKDTVSFKLLTAPTSARLNNDSLQWQATFQENSEFTLEATDSKGASTIQNFVLKVNNTGSSSGSNTAPVITSVPFLGGIHGKTYRYPVTATDADGDQVYYYFLNAVPSGMAIDYTTGIITWQYPQKGSYPIEIAATDFTADTVQKFTLTIYEQSYNQPPRITSRAVSTADTGSTYQYQTSAEDPESKPLTYAFDEFAVIPSGMTINPSTGLITWLSPQVGQYTIKWYVTDGINVAAQNYQLTVTQPINMPPKITSQPIYGAKVGQAYSYQVLAEDSDSTTLNYALKGQIPQGMTIDSNGLLTWDYPLLGAYPITITVDDGQSIVTQKYTLSVRKAPNSTSRYAPEFISQPPTLAQENRRYYYAPQVSDLDNNTLSYSLSTNPQGMTIQATNGTVSWSKPVAGKHTITIAVTDGTYTTEQTFTLTVLPKPQSGNQPPTISSQADTQITVGQSYTYQIIANDPENQTLTYAVDGSNTPIGLVIDATTGLLTWKAPTVGSHYLQIAVSDGANIVTQRWYLSVTQPTTHNQPPKFTTTPPTTTAVGDDYSYQANAVDPEGETVSYYLNGSVPSKLILDRKTGLMTWKNISPGSYSFQLIASDGEKTTTQWISIRPRNNNKAPIFTSTPIIAGSEDSPYRYQAVAADPEKKAVTYRLSGTIPNGMRIDENSGQVVWENPRTGTYQIRIEAADDYQFVAQTYQLVITTVAVNQPPAFTSTPKVTTVVNQAYHYQATAKDPEGNTVAYSLKQPPSGMTITATGNVQWTPTKAGSYTITIVASDGSQNAEQTFTLTVSQPKPADATLVKAANWIKSQVQTNGAVIASTRLSTPYQATDEAVQATALINQPITATHVNQYLLTEDIWLAEHLARKAIYQQSTSRSFTPTLTTLRQHYQATTGSYSSFIDESGNLLDTAYVIIAQAKTSKDTSVLGYVVNYLKSEQLGDGSYRLPNNDSSVYVSAKVLQALHDLDNYPVTDNITKVKNYLLTQLQQNHTTLADWELAQALLALYDVVTDKSQLSAYVSNLKQRQLSNGSFAGDVYSTALAIKAIYQFEQ